MNSQQSRRKLALLSLLFALILLVVSGATDSNFRARLGLSQASARQAQAPARALVTSNGGLLNYRIEPFNDDTWYTGISLADMDADGRPEVLAGNRETSSVEIWQHNPDLDTLVRVGSVAFPNHVHDVQAADFDGDGDMDLAVGLRFSGLHLATNTGAPGTFESWSVRELDGNYSLQVLVDDFDGDGDHDIFHGVDYGPINTWYGDGDGNFVAGAPVRDSVTEMRFARGFTAAHLDGDAYLDLIGVDGSYMRAFLNPGNRRDDWRSVGFSKAVGDYPCCDTRYLLGNVSPAAGDLDGNGVVDVVAHLQVNHDERSENTADVLIFYGYRHEGPDWDGPSVLERELRVGWPQALDASAGVADLNGDDILDVYFALNEPYEDFRAYLGDGRGAFVHEIFTLDHGVGGVNSFAVGDLNGDGGPDIVTTRYTNDRGRESGFEVLYALPRSWSWTEIGWGSASAGGISGGYGYSHEPALVTVGDEAVIAWEEEIQVPLAVGSANRAVADGYISESYVKRWDGVEWLEMGGSASGGGISSSNGDSWRVALAVDREERPVVAWMDDTPGNYEIYLRRWGSASWTELSGSASGGGVSRNSGRSAAAALADGPHGLVVAWNDTTSGPYQIYVKRWNGTGWEEMGSGSASGGGISNSTNNAYTPAVVVLPDGDVAVAWADTGSGKGEIYVKRWNEARRTWEEFSDDSAGGGGISNTPGDSFRPSLTLDSTGLPLIAWEDLTSGNMEIYVKRWDGTAWVEMGGSASGGGISRSAADSLWPSLAIHPFGWPAVAWQEGDGTETEIYVRRWDGTAWVEMGANSASGGGVSNAGGTALIPALAFLADGRAVVAWEQQLGAFSQIYVRQYVPPCYKLSLEHVGKGEDPLAEPESSPECPLGMYTAGQVIKLTAKAAAPEEPAKGYRVYGWDGTDNDSSKAEVNWVTMPESDHTVSVAYGPIVGLTQHTIYSCYNGNVETEPNNGWMQADGPLCGDQKPMYGRANDTEDYYLLDLRFSPLNDISVTVTEHYGTGAQLFLLSGETSVIVAEDRDARDGLRIAYEDGGAERYFIAVYTPWPDPNETRQYALYVEAP